MSTSNLNIADDTVSASVVDLQAYRRQRAARAMAQQLIAMHFQNGWSQPGFAPMAFHAFQSSAYPG